jgi:hypothetical protein
MAHSGARRKGLAQPLATGRTPLFTNCVYSIEQFRDLLPVVPPKKPAMSRKKIPGVRCFGLPLFCLFLFARNAAAQDPIRVQSDEVLVPTVVFNREVYAQLKMKPHRRDSYGHLMAKDARLWDDMVVKNLTVKDFHLYEDGQEQKIQRVKLEPPAFRVLQDNLGKHPEIVGSGGGVWDYPDLAKTDLSVWLAFPQYVLSYVPPRSARGSCHQIQVKVESAKLTVWTRSEYCNTAHPASDPLAGTEFGKKLEAAAGAATQNGIDLKMRAAVFADSTIAARAYVWTSFSWQSLAHKISNGTLYATIGSLVLVYRKDGSVAARYSDFACCDYGEKSELDDNERASDTSATAGRAMIPDRYATQFSLPAGEYDVRVVVSDGVHFGVQDAPLTVTSYDAGVLAISDVALCRRVRKVSPESEEGTRVADSYTPLASNGVEFTPAANPQYWPDQMLLAYFEVNKPIAAESGAKVQANLRIVKMDSGAIVDTFEPVDLTKYSKPGSTVIAVGRGVMLNRLPPGAYRIEVQASNAAGISTAWRSAMFTVLAAAPLELNQPPADH